MNRSSPARLRTRADGGKPGGALERVRIPSRNALARAPLRVHIVHRHRYIVGMPVTRVEDDLFLVRSALGIRHQQPGESSDRTFSELAFRRASSSGLSTTTTAGAALDIASTTSSAPGAPFFAESRMFDGETVRLAVAATFTRGGVETPANVSR